MATSAPSTAPVIPLHPTKADQPGAAPPPADRRSERKWGKAVIDVGYTIVPSVLLRAPRRLGLSPTQLAIVLVLAEYWWEPGKNPWPSKADLCNRIGLKPRQLQRHIAEMEQAGLISRKQRFIAGRKTTNEYRSFGAGSEAEGPGTGIPGGKASCEGAARAGEASQPAADLPRKPRPRASPWAEPCTADNSYHDDRTTGRRGREVSRALGSITSRGSRGDRRKRSKLNPASAPGLDESG